MKVKDAVFVKGAQVPAEYPRSGLPEVAFAGRSNVGKSSLINCLVHRSGLAKTSSTPGKTQRLYFFMVNSALSLVDLPGYGFAKVPHKVRESWGPLVEAYLKRRKELRLVVLLIDARREPNARDLQLMDWLRFYGIPCVIAVTKIDKITRSGRQKQIREIVARLKPQGGPVIPFSATTGEGKAALWSDILRACQATSE